MDRKFYSDSLRKRFDPEFRQVAFIDGFMELSGYVQEGYGIA